MIFNRTSLSSLPKCPGVYRMLNAKGKIIYIGKAKNLSHRIQSYFYQAQITNKTQKLVAKIENIEITITETEVDALLLESHLIKEFKPRYNILLKDDKSYPYIRISKAEYPRISFYRGSHKNNADYFGPYPNATAVKESLNLLQKLFKVRQCQDSFFRNRSRPCLQYQIKRCSAPCVNYISQADYQRDLEDTRLFLMGKSQKLIDNLVLKMEHSAEKLDYERAGYYRDQIQDVQRIFSYRQSTQSRNIDVFALVIENHTYCIQGLFIRMGRMLGSKSFFPKIPEKSITNREILTSFIIQNYLNQPLPDQIVLNGKIDNASTLVAALKLHAKKTTHILQAPNKGEKVKWLALAKTNAEHAIRARLSQRKTIRKRLLSLKDMLDLTQRPQHIECFDISHSLGEATIASCVVFNSQGPQKKLYRRFNIRDIEPGDDYAAMYQVLKRRYQKTIKQKKEKQPDLVLIDGGKGQVAKAQQVFDELKLEKITLVGVAKGQERRPGEETLILPQQNRELHVPPNTPGLHLIQYIRDEAHRFAITGHRNKLAKTRKQSTLEHIPGVGAKRRQKLLKHFGGIQGIMQASRDDLAKISGISKTLADAIYQHLNI